MAYTLAQFITQAQSGGGVLITKRLGTEQVIITIEKECITLADNLVSWTVSNGVKTTVNTPAGNLDLGTRFSAKQVLESVQLRNAITSGLITAEAGTVALSKTPTA